MRGRGTVVGRKSKRGHSLGDAGATAEADSRLGLVPRASTQRADAALPAVGRMVLRPRPAAPRAKAGLPLVPKQTCNQLPPIHGRALHGGRFVQRNPSVVTTGKRSKRNAPVRMTWVNPKSEIRNPKSEIRNKAESPKSETSPLLALASTPAMATGWDHPPQALRVPSASVFGTFGFRVRFGFRASSFGCAGTPHRSRPGAWSGCDR